MRVVPVTSRLNGAGILVTRPPAQAEALCQLIEAHGGRAMRFPTLDIQAVEIDDAALHQALQSDWLIFTSTNAVDFALKRLNGKMPALRDIKLAAVGQSTAKALQAAGLSVSCVPASQFSSEGLLAESAMQAVEGQAMTIVRGVGGLEILADHLRHRGASVNYLQVYRREQPDIDAAPLLAAIDRDQLAAVTITSSQALQHLLAMLDAEAGRRIRQLPLVVVSDRIRQVAQDLGFEHITVSLQPTDAAILETLTTLLSGEHSGRSI